MSMQHYHLGCPIWSNRDWVGQFFTADARPGNFLGQYSSVFNTVEGNTTFYGLPKPATVTRWGEQAAADFRFCFKFPRTISHELRLRHAQAETRTFLDCLAPLRERLGPFLLQLPPDFAPSDTPALQDYLTALPGEFDYAVEVRHPDFFGDDEAGQALDQWLQEQNIDRAILDSRALFSASPDDEDTRGAQRKKPRLPVSIAATGTQPLVRFIGHPEVAANRPFLAPWVAATAQWINEGRAPYVFMHTPNNRFAPELARLFHELLQARLENVGTLPEWPVERIKINEQLELF